MNPENNTFGYEPETIEPVSFDSNTSVNASGLDESGEQEDVDNLENIDDLYALNTPERVAEEFSDTVGGVISEYREAA